PDSNTDSFSGQMDFVGLGVYCFYDMGDMLARLVEHGGLLCDPILAQSVLGLYEQAVVGCVSGDDWMMGEHPDATGLTIYAPFRKTTYEVSITNYSTVLFTKDTMWDEFMAEISWT
ncbi:MAG: hypothetical protein QCI38_08915, partial [Candidatus Thermoplasmatota archaeon]|nr:hypothetical protein [Candidatus Thermoplasmatota archaeon]